MNSASKEDRVDYAVLSFLSGLCERHIALRREANCENDARAIASRRLSRRVLTCRPHAPISRSNYWLVSVQSPPQRACGSRLIDAVCEGAIEHRVGRLVRDAFLLIVFGGGGFSRRTLCRWRSRHHPADHLDRLATARMMRAPIGQSPPFRCRVCAKLGHPVHATDWRNRWPSAQNCLDWRLRSYQPTSQQRHCSRSATGADPTGLQRACYRRAGDCCTAEGRTSSDGKKSVLADHIVCLDCGKHFSMLRRHLMTDHKMTPQQYRQRWDLPSTYPMVAPDYAKTRSTIAKKIGLGQRIRRHR